MAQLLAQVIGHESQKKQIQTAIQLGRLPHSMLFVGPSGVGKKKIAFAFAQYLVCQNKNGCGECGSCIRLYKGASEALLYIHSEKNQIKIEQAKEIIEFLKLKSISSCRVIIIDEVTSLNPQAANSLLKILEEPPEETFFFLISSTSQIMATLKSRSQIMRFYPLNERELARKGQFPDWALRSCHGSFEKLNMLVDKEEISARQSSFYWLEQWALDPFGYLRSDFKDILKDRSEAQRLFYYWSLAFRDLLFCKLDGGIINSDLLPMFQRLSFLSEEELFRNYSCCRLAYLGIQANRDAALVAEEFWISTRPEKLLESVYALD